MADLIGRLTTIAIGREETAYGTKSAQLVDIPVQEISVDPSVEISMNDQAFGRIEDLSSGNVQGQRSCEVTIKGIISDGFFGQFLKGVLGTIGTDIDTPVAGAITHTFSVLETNAHPSYSIIYKDTNDVKIILGALVQRLQINIVNGDWATYEITLVGRFPADTTETIVPVVEVLFHANEAVMKIASLVAGLGAATAIEVESGSITIEKNLEKYPTWGSNELTRVINKQFSVTGAFKMLYDDSTHFDVFDLKTVQAMSVTLTSLAMVTGTTPYSLAFTIPAMFFTGWSAPRSNDDLIQQSIDFKAQYDVATSKMIDAVLINDTAGASY